MYILVLHHNVNVRFVWFSFIYEVWILYKEGYPYGLERDIVDLHFHTYLEFRYASLAKWFFV